MMEIHQDKNYLNYYNMKQRDSKGRVIKTSNHVPSGKFTKKNVKEIIKVVLCKNELFILY